MTLQLCKSLNLLKYCLSTFFFICQLIISWSTSGEFKYVCLRLLFCILTRSLCVIRQAYVQQHSTIRKYLRKPQALRQVHMAPYSLSHRPNLRGHISLMLNYHWALKLLFVFWLLFFLFFFFLVSPWFIFHLDHFSRLTYCLVNLGKKVNPECIRAFEMELVITEPGLYSGHHSSPLQSHHLPHTF